MPKIFFTPNLERYLHCATTQVTGETVSEVLEQVFTDHPRLRSYVLDDQNRLRQHITIFVDGTAVTDRLGLTDPVGEGSEIWVLQALSGGSDPLPKEKG